MDAAAGLGPDLVIAGAARSGTSFLAARLAEHPDIDPGAVKEPNYFSRQFDQGEPWYAGQFAPRRAGLVRMDASVSYTYPQYPEALERIRTAAGTPYIVYLVRDPVPRAVSHYLYYRHYFKTEAAETFSAALRANPLYAGASDYARWIPALQDTFGRERVLVVPFGAATKALEEVAARICAELGLDPMPDPDTNAAAHQNNVVTFKHPALRWASRKLRRSRLYPIVREKLGAGRLRRLRSLATKDTTLPPAAEVLASIDREQAEQLRDLERRADAAVRAVVSEQDQRLGTSWATYWKTPDAVPSPAGTS